MDNESPGYHVLVHQPAQKFAGLKVQNPPVVSAALVVAFAEQGQVQTAESAGSWQKMAAMPRRKNRQVVKCQKQSTEESED